MFWRLPDYDDFRCFDLENAVSLPMTPPRNYGRLFSLTGKIYNAAQVDGGNGRL